MIYFFVYKKQFKLLRRLKGSKECHNSPFIIEITEELKEKFEILGQISRVNCQSQFSSTIVNFKRWPSDSKWSRPIIQGITLIIHLNLSYEKNIQMKVVNYMDLINVDDGERWNIVDNTYTWAYLVTFQRKILLWMKLLQISPENYFYISIRSWGVLIWKLKCSSVLIKIVFKSCI